MRKIKLGRVPTILLVLIVIVSLSLILMAAGIQQVFRGSVAFYGEVSGIPLVYTFSLADADAASSMWVLGDTTAAGMYVPEQPIEIQDLKVLWDPDSGDSIRVIVYAANGDGANETIVDTDTLTGSAVVMVDDNSVSSTYKTVTPSEGLAIRYIAINGSPNDVQIILEAKTRISDAYE